MIEVGIFVQNFTEEMPNYVLLSTPFMVRHPHDHSVKMVSVGPFHGMVSTWSLGEDGVGVLPFMVW